MKKMDFIIRYTNQEWSKWKDMKMLETFIDEMIKLGLPNWQGRREPDDLLENENQNSSAY